MEKPSMVERMVAIEMKLDKTTKCVVMHKNTVWNKQLFDSVQQARNEVKFRNPKRKFKEPTPNTFVCSHYGTKFEILELSDKI